MQRMLLITALAAVAISLPAAATGKSAATSLVGTVGPGLTITLSDANGGAVTHLDPGDYVISIDDRSILHNYHLFGPGVEQRTDIETTGMTTWNVTMTDGTYDFRCDAHPTSMKGSFTVGAAPPPPPPPTKLAGKVTATTISLKRAGTRVRSVVEGTFKVAVSDTSKTQNFHLTGPGVNKKTGVKARTKVTWTLELAVGKYTYRSDKKRRLRGTFTVTPAPPA
jgi:plastocyanin